jgi:uncharacterized protein (DUF305 family)
MIPYHEGGHRHGEGRVEICHGPETKRMAQPIVEAREKDVADMQAWVTNNGP